ncbi:MAG: OmpH family outer membrane protein [Rikenellaceae bacterium]
MFALIAANCNVANAQKIGTVLFQEIMLVLPETDSVQSQIQKKAQELEADLEAMRVEFNNKASDFETNKENYTPAISEQKQKELIEIQTRYQNYTQAAQSDIESIQMKLTQPILKKVADMIQTVSKENGLLMVVDLTQGNNIMYVDEENSMDITPIVKERLGVDRDAVPNYAALGYTE